MTDLRKFDIKYLKGIGPARAKLLAEELDVHSLWDLLHHFPNHYIDRSQIYPIDSFTGEEMPLLQVKGRFVSLNIVGEGRKLRLVGLFTDGRTTMEVVWFTRVRDLKEVYHTGVEYVLFGKPQRFNMRWSMTHPEVDRADKAMEQQGLRGIYPMTEKLRNCSVTQRMIFTWVQAALERATDLADPLPQSVLETLRLMPLSQALRVVHTPPPGPEGAELLARGRERLKFEELFFLELNLRRFSRRRSVALGGIVFPTIGKFFNDFYSQQLAFPLTQAQKRVLREIRADLGSGRQMNRLLQGDVGSGKTVVALMTMLMALDNGFQAALMAPTEILAAQHYETLSQLCSPLGINVRLLTGSTPRRERAEIDAQLGAGELHILIGTHALIEDRVQFRRLGLVVIDEQHRFGVMQRAKMWQKGVGMAGGAPHVLVMTATPIPRTLAMTVYGDLDVSIIDELPPGRKPVTTLLRYDDQRLSVYQSIGRQLKQGHQAYIVYPLIEENEKVDLKSLNEGYDFVREMFPSYRVAMVHGRMKPQEKDYQMGLFASHQADILVATTVIEVGVNVPNATTMLIENAERFGLSQLHQLRGRVGRGGDQSYCVLMSKRKIGGDTRKRLELMTQTTDGFVIAEADMAQRGPGDIEGTLQSGTPITLGIASLASDGHLVQLSRQWADKILDEDPSLENHAVLRDELALRFPRQLDFSRIS